MNRYVALFFLLLIVSLGCSSKMNMNNQKTEKMTSIFEGNFFGNGEEGLKKENLIITSEKEWNSFLKKIDKTNEVSNQFDSNIDFTKKSAIISIDLVRNTGGFSIKMIKALFKRNTIEIVVQTKGPKPTDMVTSAVMQPFHIVTIDKTNKTIIFVEK